MMNEIQFFHIKNLPTDYGYRLSSKFIRVIWGRRFVNVMSFN